MHVCLENCPLCLFFMKLYIYQPSLADGQVIFSIGGQVFADA